MATKTAHEQNNLVKHKVYHQVYFVVLYLTSCWNIFKQKV